MTRDMFISEIARYDFLHGYATSHSPLLESYLTGEQDVEGFLEEYNNIKNSLPTLRGNDKQFAVLQMKQGLDEQGAERVRFQDYDMVTGAIADLSSNNYDMIYHAEKTDLQIISGDRFNNDLYAELNSNALRPYNYYGYSLSMSDIIVQTDIDRSLKAYFVNDVGFRELDTSFIREQDAYRIMTGLDVKQEVAMLNRIKAFAKQTQNEAFITAVNEDVEFKRLTSAYAIPFEIASVNDLVSRRTPPLLAIESTDDYTDIESGFVAENGNERFRVVAINQDGFVYPVNRDVYNSHAEANEILEQAPNIRIGTYDDIVHLTGDIITNKALADMMCEKDEHGYIPITRAEDSNFEGYSTIVITKDGNDKRGQGVFLGKTENIDYYNGVYDNADNSLFFIAENLSFELLLDKGGRVTSQQEVLNAGYVSVREFEKYNDLKNHLLNHLRQTEEVKFEVDIEREGSGVEFSYPQWGGMENQKTAFENQADFDNFFSNSTGDISFENMTFYEIRFPLTIDRVVSFEGCRFNDCDFAYLEKENADFENCTIYGGAFEYSKLSSANFKNSTLANVRFYDVDLTNADFSNTYIKDCPFDVCTMSGVDFTSTRFNGSMFRRNVIDTPVIGLDRNNITMGGATSDEVENHRDFVVAGLTHYEPIPNRYYDADLELDGTAEELYNEARYIENPLVLARVEEILRSENMFEQADYVHVMQEVAEESQDRDFGFAQMKKDLLDEQFELLDDVSIGEGDLRLSVTQERGVVVVSLQDLESGAMGASRLTAEEFMAMTATDFDRFVGEVHAYSMQEMEQEQEAERMIVQPIKEFFHPNNGMMVEGERISSLPLIEAGVSFGYADRSEVYNAVREFEQINNIERPTIDENGQYEDKDFLYNAYDRYVAMSHADELDLFEDMSDTLKAEIYYAMHNIKDSETLDRSDAIAYIEALCYDEAMKRYADVDKVRFIRHAFETGATMEQVNILAEYQSSYVAEHIYDFMQSGATQEQLEAVKNVGSQDVAYYITDALKNGMNTETAQLIIDTFAEINNWNEQQWANGTPTQIRSYQTEYQLQGMIEYAGTITNAITKTLCDEYVAQVKERGELVDFTDFANKFNFAEIADVEEIYETALNNDITVKEGISQIEAICNNPNVDEESRKSGAFYIEQLQKIDREETQWVQDFAVAQERFQNGDYLLYGVSDINTDRNGFVTDINTFAHILTKEEEQVTITILDRKRGDNIKQFSISNDDFTQMTASSYKSAVAHFLGDASNVAPVAFENLRPQLQQVIHGELQSKLQEQVTFELSQEDDLRNDTYKLLERNSFKLENGKVVSTMAVPHGEEKTAPTTSVEGVEQDGEKKNNTDVLRDRLESGIKDVMNGEKFKDFLSTSSHLFYNNYSFNNAMLVWLQKPEASHVMGYETWKEYGRTVTRGATGAKIMTPVMAYEKSKGALFGMIKSNLNGQLSQDASLSQAIYRVGTSKLEFTMNRSNHLIGLRNNGKEVTVFDSDEKVKKFIDTAILGKVPMYFSVATVFDAKDVAIPDFLWLKKGFRKDELIKDENGKPIKNRRGEYKVVNSPERQARFQPNLDTKIVAQDPARMAILLDVLKATSERNGVPVYSRSVEEDSHLKSASGYFKREFTPETPKGFIALCSDMELTEQCSALMHEMAHSDLHGNLQALADKMGEDKISSPMREVQAESIAFMTANHYGIETDTSSFNYIALYTKGFELQDFHKSLNVIVDECKKLNQDINAELDLRGLNIDLSEKPKDDLMLEDTIKTVSASYGAYAVSEAEQANDILNELPKLAQEHKNVPMVMDILAEKQKNVMGRIEDVGLIDMYLDKLKSATTREEQQSCLDCIVSAQARIGTATVNFEKLTNDYMQAIEANTVSLKQDFVKDAVKTLNKMKADYPQLDTLSKSQLTYIAKSDTVRNMANLLNTNPQAFVDTVVARAEAVNQVAGKNGVFVELSWCEQWTDKALIQDGAICHPKVADSIIKQGEAQLNKLVRQAEEKGEYFPYTKCKLTVFMPHEKKGLVGIETRIDVGHGEQTSLTDHLKQFCVKGERKQILEAFEKATRELKAKEKIVVPTVVQHTAEQGKEHEAPVQEAERTERGSKEDWNKDITTLRETGEIERDEQTVNEPSKKRENNDKESR